MSSFYTHFLTESFVSLANLELTGNWNFSLLDSNLVPPFPQTAKLLDDFYHRPDFPQQMSAVFDQDKTSEARFELPSFSVLSASELQGALGAYSASNNQIFLSQEFLIANQDNPQVLTAVLLEEMGHAIDAQVNSTDTPGDEGAIFAQQVLGNEFSPEALAQLKQEDDRATIVVNGEPLVVEQATFTVTNTNDSGSGSLRDAITQANQTPGIDRITIDPTLTGETITLEDGQLEITDDLDLEGEEITITASENSRIFLLDDGDENNNIDVSIDGLTLIDGVAENGGAILNRENLVLRNSELRGNSATSDGGGILNSNGNLTIDRSTLAENRANLGGAIDDDGSGDREFNLTNSTISGNEASENVGGVDNSANLRITNSTISGNTAFGDAGGVKNSGTLTVNNSTFSNNLASNRGGGVFNYGQFNLTNSIIANSLSGDDVNNLGGVVNLQGVNLIEDGSLEDAIAQDPNLSSLQDNGGSTRTHLPLEGSPVIDAGENSLLAEGIEFDQRGEGFERIVETVDLGAVEVQPEGSPPDVDDQSFTIDENSAVDSVVGTIEANDPEGESITYRFSENIDLDNDGDNTFLIDEATGEITVGDSGELDFETREIITFDVIVSDGGRQSTATITVNLNDIDESDLEPNDIIDEAVDTGLSSDNPGSVTYNLAIGDGGLQERDVDLFALQVNAGETIIANIDTEESSSLDSVLTIFDSVGRQVAFNDDFDKPDPFIELNVPRTDTYYVGVSSFETREYSPLNTNDRVPGSTGDYSIALNVTPPAQISEPNDTIGQATPIDQEDFTANSFIGDNSTLDNPNLDVDLYQLTLSEGETATIDIDTSVETPFDTIIRIFNQNGREVVFNDNRQAPGENFSTVDPYVQFTAPNSGNYFVGISTAVNENYRPFAAESGTRAGGTGNYQIQITQPDAGEQEEEDPTNDTLETASEISVGDNLEGVIGDRADYITVPGLDVDLYRLSLNEDQEISISLNSTSRLDPVLRFFNSNGAEIAFNDDLGNSSNAFLELTIRETGEYYIGVSGFDNSNYNPEEEGSGVPFASTGSYELTLSEQETPQLEAGAEEENDTLATATPTELTLDNPSLKQTNAIGNNTSLQEAGLDVDLFQVNLDANTRLTTDINTANLDSNLDSLLHIFDEDGNSIAFNDNESINSNDSFLEFVPTEAGTYYIGVSGLGNEAYDPNTGEDVKAGRVGEYEIEITLSEAIPEETSTNDTRETAIETELTNNRFTREGFIGDNPDVQADVDFYEIDLEAGETLTIEVNGGNSNLESFVQLFRGNGEDNLLEEEYEAGDFPNPELSLEIEEDDTYFLAVSAFDEDGNGSEGEYTLTLEVEPPAAALPPIEGVRPTINNDTASTNSDEAIDIDVLTNDTANDAQGVLELDDDDFPKTTEKGGTVTLEDERLVYTPDPDFAGVDTFTYTASNESGSSAQGTVEVTVDRPLDEANVQVILQVQPLSSEDNQLSDGLQIGEEFLVDVRFVNLKTETDSNQTVVFGHADLLFDPNVLQVVEDSSLDEDGIIDGILRNPEYNIARKGLVVNEEGLVNEVGAGASASANNLPEENRIFSLHLRAVGGGNTTLLASEAGQSPFSTINILDAPGDQRSQTNFGAINSLEETANLNNLANALAPRLNLANANQVVALEEEGITGVQGMVEAMEVTVDFQDAGGTSLREVEVGDEFNIVLSAEDLRPQGEQLGVLSAFADLVYDTVLVDIAPEVTLFEPFVRPLGESNQVIEEAGLVDELGGSNSNFTPVRTGSQTFAVLTATAKAQGQLEVSTNAPEGQTAKNTLFGVDVDVTEGTRYGGNTLNIVGDEPDPGNADLVITSFDAEIDHVLGGETRVSMTVENQGEGAASGFQVEVLYYTADNIAALAQEEPVVVKTLAFDRLEAQEEASQTSEVSLPVETLLVEALEDDPSKFGEPRPEGGVGSFKSNNIDYLGVRIVNSDSSGEEANAFANNDVNEEEGVNIDDIAYFPWDFLNNTEQGVKEGEEDELITDGFVTGTDVTAVFRNIGLQDQAEGQFGVDLERIDFDLDGAISPVDAVRVVNRLNYEINPKIFEGDLG